MKNIKTILNNVVNAVKNNKGKAALITLGAAAGITGGVLLVKHFTKGGETAPEVEIPEVEVDSDAVKDGMDDLFQASQQD